MVGWHHWLNGLEFEQTPGDSEGQGSLICCSVWGCKDSDTTKRVNNNKNVELSFFSTLSWSSRSSFWELFLWFTYFCLRQETFTEWLLKWYDYLMQNFLKTSILLVLSGKEESLGARGLCMVGVDILPTSGWEISELVGQLEKWAWSCVERNYWAVPGLCEFGCGITCLLHWAVASDKKPLGKSTDQMCCSFLGAGRNLAE